MGVGAAVDRDADVVDLLRAIRNELQALRADLQRDRRRPGAISRTDRDQLTRLLPALVGAHGSDEFAIHEVIGLPAVRAATHLAAPQLGQLLKRAAGVPIGGYVVQCAGAELHRRLWRVVALV